MKVFVNKELTNEDKELDLSFRQAVEAAIERQKALGTPVARYNEMGAYLEYPDGTIKKEI